MKKIIACLALFASFIIACNTGNKSNSILSKPGEIIADEYTINVDKDTTLVTKNGALLDIPKGSLSIGKGNTIVLEIREAYSIQQMILAGLTTESNGQLLSSGGMIYINAKAGQNVTIKQAIKVSIPNDYLDPSMQLYKGEKGKDETINWVNPTALPANKQMSGIEQGKQLFLGKCASCHQIGKDATGPNLANFLKRFKGDKLLARGHTLHLPQMFESGFIYDNDSDSGNYYHPLKISSELWNNQFLYFCNLKSMYGSLGTAFPDLAEESLNNIYRYIQKESDEKNLAMPLHVYLDDCIDSCMAYNKVTEELQKKRYIIKTTKDKLIKDNGKLVIEKKEVDTSNADANNIILPPAPPDPEKVSPKNYDAVYYQFTIETFGWFNIDVLIKGKNGVEESELFVRVIGEYREKVQVYLIIPSVKVYAQGGSAERNPEEFAFLYRSGKIELPQNAKAYILAVSETKSSLTFTIKEFTTSKQQEFELRLLESTKEEFNIAINNISGDKLKIHVEDSKNAQQIRKTDDNLKVIEEELRKAQNLKPKNCNCNCGNEGDTARPSVAKTK